MRGKQLSHAEVQSWIAQQPKAKGYTWSIATGTNNTLSLQLPGDQEKLLGISVNPEGVTATIANQPNSLKLEVNNEVIIKDLHSSFLNPANNELPFYPFERPLTGKDEINMTATGVTAGDLYVVLYYV
jgi:hypothetical protein